MKKLISKLFRDFRLIEIADLLRFRLEKYKNRKNNNDFKSKYPAVKLPPDYLIYESFRMDYDKYYNQGRDTAVWLVEYFEKYLELSNKNILDWGCGPARVLRHMPEVIGRSCNYFGTDYNKNSIDWCKKNIEGIAFNLNSLKAELPYEDNSMDIIYGISIFTHLSEKLHYEWYNELYRVLRSGGIMFMTTHGDNFKPILTASEITHYEQGKLVARGKVKEGHRVYTTFQPKKFMEQLFQNVEILDFVEIKPTKDWTPQDIWIIRK